jgi:hypothetical protein
VRRLIPGRAQHALDQRIVVDHLTERVSYRAVYKSNLIG